MTSDAQNESTSAIAIWNSLRSSHDITVQGNLIAGGGFSIYAEDYSPSEGSPSGGYAVTDISFSNNVSATICSVASATTVSGFHAASRLTDGNAKATSCWRLAPILDTSNPTYQGHICN